MTADFFSVIFFPLNLHSSIQVHQKTSLCTGLCTKQNVKVNETEKEKKPNFNFTVILKTLNVDPGHFLELGFLPTPTPTKKVQPQAFFKKA